MRATGQALARVRHPHRRIAPQTHVLTVRSDDGATFEVQGTEEHPFWSPDEDAWVPMAELAPGDALSADGVRSVVLDRRVVDGDVEVFNVEVDGLHNYVVVGEDGGVVVHNGGPCGIKIPNSELLGPPPRRGRAPIGSDGQPVELHHRGQKPDSPLDEMTRTDHRGAGNFKRNHENTGQSPSHIDQSTRRAQRRRYWKAEYDSGRFDDL